MKTTTKKPVKRPAKKMAAAISRVAKKKPGVADGLRELFIDELKDIYWAEKALTKAIPKMIKNSTSQELIKALKTHLEETNGQVERLEEIFASIGAKAVAKKCEAMEGIIKEASEIMQETEEGAVRDAGIISAGQKVEHYEIATYGTLVAFAKALGEEEAISLLVETLNEEKQADEILSQVSEKVNAQALSDTDEEEDDEEEEEEEEDDEEEEEEEEE
jgi:ferritin-like metal-binding protein YciE